MTGRHPATAARRTDLLHRMLLLRHDGDREGRPGEEALEVGLRAALGPADTLVPGHRTGGPALAVELATADILKNRPAVVVCLVCEDEAAGFADTLGREVQDGLPVLFCCTDTHETGPGGLPAGDVDGTDVEAVTLAAQTALHPVRAGAGPGLLHLRTYPGEPGPRHDPIRILTDRMRTDHQLDEHSLAALERHVAAELGA